MRIGTFLDVDPPFDHIVEQMQVAVKGNMTSVWAPQIFGFDALTALAVAATKVPGIGLGTAVVPVHTRHPTMLAQQALTVQSITGNRLTLGIGLSHAMVVEGMWGLSWARGARYMREYLSILMPLLSGERADLDGELMTTHASALQFEGANKPDVIVAALGELMLKTAGELADGTVTWMTGVGTVAGHIVPHITKAAEEAGRPHPRVVVVLPVCLTDDVDTARDKINRAFAIYPHLPSYKAMLDKEGATLPADVAIVGDQAEIEAGIERLRSAGATDFVAGPTGPAEDVIRTQQLLAELAG